MVLNYTLAVETSIRRLREELQRIAAASKAGVITHGEVARALGLAPADTTLRLRSLVRRGWLKRIRRGVYLVLPLEADPGARPTVEDPWVLAGELFGPCYIGGWSAAEHWGLTEQIFRSTFVVTGARARRSRLRLSGMEFRIVRVQPSCVESVSLVWRGKERVRVSGPERTIADALANPSWLGGIRAVIDALSELRASDRWKPERLLAELESVGVGSAFKRFGYIAETLQLVDPKFLRTLLDRRTTGLAKLDPAISVRGRLNKRWGVWVNASVGPRETT